MRGTRACAAVIVRRSRFLEERLVGLKPEDESRDLDVSFPADYGYKKWAGKTIGFHVKVKEIKEKILPSLDEEFAKDLGGFDSLEALKVKLREDIQKVKEMTLDRHLKDQIEDQLLQKNSFEIPPSLVEDQNQALISEAKVRLASQGMNLKDMDISEDKLREDYRAVAERQVKTYLILEKIAGQEGLTWAMIPDAVEVDEFESGARHEGMFYALVTLFRKVASSIAIPTTLLVLDWSGFVANANIQSNSAVWAIRILIGPVPSFFLLGGILFARFYPLSREIHAETRAAIAARRASNTPAN